MRETDGLRNQAGDGKHIFAKEAIHEETASKAVDLCPQATSYENPTASLSIVAPLACFAWDRVCEFKSLKIMDANGAREPCPWQTRQRKASAQFVVRKGR